MYEIRPCANPSKEKERGNIRFNKQPLLCLTYKPAIDLLVFSCVDKAVKVQSQGKKSPTAKTLIEIVQTQTTCI